jgi:hypothetical protein
MDATSHNITWQIFTFGEHQHSRLNDVAIIDPPAGEAGENNIWAVGEIYMNDSIGQADPTRYNLALWDENDWEIERVLYYYLGQSFYNPIQSFFAFSLRNIWLCGNGVIHWDSNQYIPISIPSNIWGSYQMNKI